MSDYFDGAIMAYRDAQEWTKGLAEKLPAEVAFLKPQFMELSYAFGNKANEVIRMKIAANEQTHIDTSNGGGA